MTTLVGDVFSSSFIEPPFLVRCGVVNEKMDPTLGRAADLLCETDFVKSRPDVEADLRDETKTLVKFRRKNCFLPNIIVPSNEMLKRIAEDYKKKYGIDIVVCEKDQLISRIDDFCHSEIKFFGVIITLPSGYGHVLPLILNFQEGVRQVFSLNVGSNKRLEEKVVSFLRGLDFEVFFSLDERQYDYFSCRTEATVILRNALLDMRERELKRFDAFLVPDNTHDSTFFTPKEWTYGAQIIRDSLDLDKIDVIHQKYSKIKEKREDLESIQEYRERHTEEILIKSVCKWVFLYLENPKTNIEVPIHSELRKTSFWIKTWNSEDSEEEFEGVNYLKLVIRDEVIKTSNVFLALKGFKNAIKYGFSVDLPDLLLGYF